MSRRSLTRVVLPLGIALAAGATLVALPQMQTAPATSTTQPQLYMLVLNTIHPGMGAEYVEFHKNELMPAQQKGGMQSRMAWSTGVFGEAGSFAFLIPIQTLADFDGPNPMVKALGEQGAAALAAKGTRFTVSLRVLLVTSRPDLSYIPDPKAAPTPLALLSQVQTTPGRRMDFETLIKSEVVPIMQRAKVSSYRVLEVSLGEPAGTYYTAIGYDSYAAMSKGHPFQTVLGEEGARKLEAKFAGIVTRLERSVLRFRPELSFGPPRPSN